MLMAIFWSTIATGTLLVGMVLAYRNVVTKRWTGLIMAFDAFAAGALLVMLTDSMIPESFEHGGKAAVLSLVFGFGVAVTLSLMQMA